MRSALLPVPVGNRTKGEEMARMLTWLATRDERGQGTVEYFLVILAATALKTWLDLRSARRLRPRPAR